MAAACLFAGKLPADRQLDLPAVKRRIWFSTQLLEPGTSPTLTKWVLAHVT